MLESILSSVVILALGGAICKLFYDRLNRLEDKIDFLITKNGSDYQPKQNKKRGESNDD